MAPRAAWRRPRSLHKRALAIQERTFGPDHANVASTLHTLANLYRDHGRFGEAEDLLTRVLAIRDKLGDPGQIAGVLEDVAVVRDWQGRAAEAETLYKRALTIYEQAYGAEPLANGCSALQPRHSLPRSGAQR